MKIIFGVFITLLSIVNGEIYNCKTNKTVYLKLNEIAFFETTNFPALMTKKEFKKCNLTFVFVGNTTKKHELFISHLETRYSPSPVKYDYEYIFDILYKSSYSLAKSISQKYISQQGFVIFVKRKEACFFQSIASKNKPFKFKNEKQFFYFTSDRYTGTAGPACEWNYVAPLGYGFKIVVESIFHTSVFYIRNTTDMLVNKRSLILEHPYYNGDKQIQIYSTDNKENHFEGYVTVVKKVSKKINGSCSIEKNENENEIVWTNIKSHPNGYKNNAYCPFNLVIPPNTTILVDIQILCLERNVDVVRYHPDEFNVVTLNQTETDFSNSDIEFILNSYNNGSGRNVLWEFESDGSVQALGFKLSFTKLVCQCANPIIECDGNDHFIMNTSYFYCGNLVCNYTIKPCKTKLTLVYIVFDISKAYVSDVFRIISNGYLIWQNEIFPKNEYFKVYLNSSNQNILQAITVQTHTIKSISFTLEPVRALDPVVDLRVTLSPDTPSYVLDISLYNLTLFIIEGTLDYSFSLFSTYIYGISIYNNESLTYNLKNDKCFGMDNYECVIKNNEFAIFYEMQNPEYLAVQLSDGSKGCVFKKQTYIMQRLCFFKNKPYKPIVALANADDQCVLTIIGQMSLYRLWTTASSENIKIYSSGRNQKNKVFEFNSKSAWNLVSLDLEVFTIIIPRSTSIYLKYVYWYYEIEITSHPFHSILSYDTSMVYSESSYTSFKLENVTVKFTAFEYNMPNGKRFWIKANKKKYFFNITGDIMLFSNQNFVLGYDLFESNVHDHGTIIYVETIHGQNFNTIN